MATFGGRGDKFCAPPIVCDVRLLFFGASSFDIACSDSDTVFFALPLPLLLPATPPYPPLPISPKQADFASPASPHPSADDSGRGYRASAYTRIID